MSGIVGIVHLDGSAVNSDLVHKLTDFLSFRGVDGRHTHIQGNVGFGHTLFKTIEECEWASQPLTLDGKNWIVADARVDARDELVANLKSAGQREVEPPGWTDAELILRAYNAWGENCVEHLLGDFAFAIWDGSRQQLFCARDHMGVKPFYYAQVGSTVIFSNTLDCVRQHPLVSNKLNDLAIADFLLFSVNQDPATTSFHDIRRIPPAHFMAWPHCRPKQQRYWSMPVDEPLFYKRKNEYVDQFHELLGKSVHDRLRARRIGILMSGGLDSPTLAAVAHQRMSQRNMTFELRAVTRTSKFVPSENRYASKAANHLGIQIDFHDWTDVTDFRWEHISFALPEPTPVACLVPSDRQFWHKLKTYSRVFLYGEGPDNALALDWKAYVGYLLKTGRHKQAFVDLLAGIVREKRPPFWGRIWNTIANLGDCQAEPGQKYPVWLDKRFESRLQLRDRWRAYNSANLAVHPIRPTAYASFQNPLWQRLFEHLDASSIGGTFEVRYPFLDLRMLRFFLAVPALPWCRSKYLIREAMRGYLPNAILRRKKATTRLGSLYNFLSKFCQNPLVPTSEIRAFIIPQRLSPGSVAHENDVESNLRIRSLNHWLQNYRRSSDNL